MAWEFIYVYLFNTPPVMAAVVAVVGTIVVGVLTLVGVGLSLRNTRRISRDDRAHAVEQANLEREEAAKQANVEREAAAQQATINRAAAEELANLNRSNAAAEAHKERVATARRIVYLEAVAELVNIQSFIGSLSSIDLPSVDLSAKLTPFNTAVYKVAIIGNIETSGLIRQLQTMMMTMVLECLQSVMPIVGLKAQADTSKTYYDHTQIEIQRLLASMNMLNSSKQSDPLAFAALNASYESQQQLARTYGDQLSALNKDIQNERMRYLSKVVQESRPAIAKLDEVAVAIRGELDLDGTLNEFRAQTQASQDSVDAVVKKLRGSRPEAPPMAQALG